MKVLTTGEMYERGLLGTKDELTAATAFMDEGTKTIVEEFLAKQRYVSDQETFYVTIPFAAADRILQAQAQTERLDRMNAQAHLIADRFPSQHKDATQALEAARYLGQATLDAVVRAQHATATLVGSCNNAFLKNEIPDIDIAYRRESAKEMLRLTSEALNAITMLADEMSLPPRKD